MFSSKKWIRCFFYFFSMRSKFLSVGPLIAIIVFFTAANFKIANAATGSSTHQSRSNQTQQAQQANNPQGNGEASNQGLPPGSTEEDGTIVDSGLSEEELKKFKPSQIEQILKESGFKIHLNPNGRDLSQGETGQLIMSLNRLKSLKKHGDVLTKIMQFPAETISFGIMIGSLAWIKLYNAYHLNPVGGEQFIQSQLDPVGQFGFYLFMLTQGKFMYHAESMIFLNAIKQGKLPGHDSYLQRAIPMIGMSLGMLAQSISSEVILGASACLDRSKDPKKQEMNKLSCDDFYVNWTKNILPHLGDYVPGLASMLTSTAFLNHVTYMARGSFQAATKVIDEKIPSFLVKVGEKEFSVLSKSTIKKIGALGTKYAANPPVKTAIRKITRWVGSTMVGAAYSFPGIRAPVVAIEFFGTLLTFGSYIAGRVHTLAWLDINETISPYFTKAYNNLAKGPSYADAAEFYEIFKEKEQTNWLPKYQDKLEAELARLEPLYQELKNRKEKIDSLYADKTSDKDKKEKNEQLLKIAKDFQEKIEEPSAKIREKYKDNLVSYLDDFNKKMSTWRQVNYLEALTAHNNWREYFSSMTDLHNAARGFYVAFVDEAKKGLPGSENSFSYLRRNYPLNGVIAKGAEARTGKFFNDAENTIKLQLETVKDAAAYLDKTLYTDLKLSRDLKPGQFPRTLPGQLPYPYYKSDLDSFLEAKIAFETQDENKIGMAILQLRKSYPYNELRFENTKHFKTSRCSSYCRIFKALFQILGPANPYMEEGRGFIAAYKYTYQADLEAIKLPTSWAWELRNETESPADFIAFQMICGPSYKDTNNMFIKEKGYKIQFFPPRIHNQDKFVESFCRQYKTLPIAKMYGHKLADSKAKSSKEYSGPIPFLANNILSEIYGDQQTNLVSDWWDTNIQPELIKSYVEMTPEYNKVVKMFMERLTLDDNREFKNFFKNGLDIFNSSPLKNGVLGALQQEVKIYLSVLDLVLRKIENKNLQKIWSNESFLKQIQMDDEDAKNFLDKLKNDTLRSISEKKLEQRAASFGFGSNKIFPFLYYTMNEDVFELSNLFESSKNRDLTLNPFGTPTYQTFKVIKDISNRYQSLIDYFTSSVQINQNQEKVEIIKKLAFPELQAKSDEVNILLKNLEVYLSSLDFEENSPQNKYQIQVGLLVLSYLGGLIKEFNTYSMMVLLTDYDKLKDEEGDISKMLQNLDGTKQTPVGPKSNLANPYK